MNNINIVKRNLENCLPVILTLIDISESDWDYINKLFTKKIESRKKEKKLLKRPAMIKHNLLLVSNLPTWFNELAAQYPQKYRIVQAEKYLRFLSLLSHLPRVDSMRHRKLVKLMMFNQFSSRSCRRSTAL